MDIASALSQFATGAAGCLAMLKAIKLAESRKRKSESELEAERLITADDVKNAIAKLIIHNRSRVREATQLQEDYGALCERLDRAGIP
jgi:hypothetical protein